MTTQQLGTVIGGVIGYFVGYPQLGLVVGGLLGAALTPGTKSEGPRLTDKKVTSSQYGTGIPTVYGNMRVGGTIVDSTDKIEIPTTTESGKGGGNENTTYQYLVNMAMVLCDTPDDGSMVYVGKLWKDGKLIYDASTGISVGSALASAESPFAFAVLYQGREDQLPDPIEELNHGVGNVPAYRGVVRLRLNLIDCPGGRVPQFSAEVCRAATVAQATDLFAETPISGAGDVAYAVIRKDAAWHVTQAGNAFDGTYRLKVSYVSAGASVQLREIGAGVAHYGLAPTPVSGDGDPSMVRLRTIVSANLNDPHQIEKYNLDTGARSVLYEYIPGVAGNVINPVSAGYDDSSGKYAVRGDAANTQNVVTILQNGAAVTTTTIPGSASGPVTIYRNTVYALSVTSGNLVLTKFDGDTGAQTNSVTGPAWSDGSSMQWAALHPSDEGIYVWIRADTQYRLYLVNPDGLGTWTVKSTTFNTTGTEKLGGCATTIYASQYYGIIGPSSKQVATFHRYNLIRFNAITRVETKVKDIISEQCQRAEMTVAQFDVSSIPDSDTVYGYTIGNPASARANIQPPMTAFAIDATEEDGKIRFFKRSAITSVVTIPYDELGAVEGDGEPGDPMPLTRAQEAELPRSVAVTYLDATFDYQQATEPYIRQVTKSVNDQTFDLPIALSGGNVAAKVAQMTLYDAWNDRNKRSLKVSRKYSYLSAGDGFTPEYPRGSFQMRRITKITDTGALLEIECVDADASIYTQTAVGSTYTSQTVSELAAPTRQVLLDIPILRDVDNNAGIYDALDSFGNTPANAELFVGNDDTNLGSRGAVTASAPIGSAETVLAAWTGNLVDETNLFTVNLGDDVFGSVTRDVLLAGGGEYWAYGAPGRWEIGASASGASLGSGRYTLSRHLRGLFGTEYLTGTHQANDTFVLLRIAGILRPSMTVGDLGQAMSYRAVTKGRSINSTSSQVYVNTGEGLRPLSPINARRAFGNRDIQVDRRSRLAMNNSTGALPLGESGESYQWLFYTSSAFTTLLATATTATSTITEAQQTAVGVTPTSTAYVRVSQLSDSVGAGHELQATV